MTLIETIPPGTRPANGRARIPRDGRVTGRARAVRTRPAPARPGGAPPRYRGSGVPMSRTPHRPRPVTPATTLALALLAGLITVWLGLVAHSGGSAAGPEAAVPGQLGVVRVQDGESLGQLAVRVAPRVPSGQVVARIRELNRLDSTALEPGQTLIAPIG